LVLAVANLCAAQTESEPKLLDKTLVVWVVPANLTQSGGSALTVNDTTIDRFDGVVFGELEPRVWMAGSNGFSRTNKEQSAWPKETATADQLVQMAIVYRGQQISIYRDGELYAEYSIDGEPYAFGQNTAVLFGQRHLQKGVDHFLGRVRDARIYGQPLDASTLRGLRPGQAVAGLEPWAWWDFASTGTYERTGRFNAVTLTGGALLRDGYLVLEGESPAMIARIERSDALGSPVPTQWSKSDPVPAAVVQSTRLLREKMLEDPYRPGYHFCVPEDNGMPGDANGCFYANGRYHLMYLYNRTGVGFCWGHISSQDLVHWRHHPDAIGPGAGDDGCFSGGAFVDDDGTAYLSYWMLWGDKGIGLARSHDRHYDRWEKLAANPVIKSTEWGITETVDAEGKPLIYGSADPTNIWKKDGKYYILNGNLLVLNKYGRQPEAPADMQGDRLYLLESTDLQNWQYKGVFYERNPAWTDVSEDNMCPSFLPLPSRPEGGTASDTHLLLFISHNKGCQYYVGDYDTQKDRFRPNHHGRMTWGDNTYFAPEALVDGQGRQIMWAWLTDNPAGEMERGWSGVFGLPRTLWLGEDGTLRMRPVPELEMLRSGEKSWYNVQLTDERPITLEGVVGDSCELAVTFPDIANCQRVGLKVRAAAGGEEETLLYYDVASRTLCFDATRSGVDGRRIVEQAPLPLPKDEPLRLRVFVDRSVVEVYANDRQAICRRVYPGRADSQGVALFVEGGTATVSEAKAWEMMPSNPY
jgi:beta-fructofuranosidase